MKKIDTKDLEYALWSCYADLDLYFRYNIPKKNINQFNKDLNLLNELEYNIRSKRWVIYELDEKEREVKK